MSSYQTALAPSADKELNDLPKKVVQRVTTAIKGLAEEPRPHECLKLQGEENLYRIRVGVYRIVYEIHDKHLLILIVRIRHRKNAY